jgi:predicted nucleic acid-binding protein
MQVFDASSMIFAWDNYPPTQFPGLWEWMANQIQRQTICQPSVAFDEVNYKIIECAAWLKENNILLIQVDNAIASLAVAIKAELGISGDGYHPKGVDENDLLIIATAHVLASELVSDEGRQKDLPMVPFKRKIPAVCDMNLVKVPCINFVGFFKRSGTVFR